ncbi:hypothetical protein VFPFJ_03819 [Purpureocillium lilacinum]|uniref:Uncharacterized protein n=1 Tax=Purpureocillium lilacinum TaxID=33203 RepID=A0A179GVP2_PURLI|nr:hypothetical protein VFPFJ_03819 [Purpureocillium lilacinum]OAQ82027.1 hypothetical protein VFPBJ_04611 [Purpureocillium lilacinum]OAQ92079.1 hypothetical protein VFPFJ_03819 [Purpureocillium lilacinum]
MSVPLVYPGVVCACGAALLALPAACRISLFQIDAVHAAGAAPEYPVLSSASAAAIAGTRSIESAWPAQRHLSQRRPSAHEIPLIPAQSMHLESLSCTL